MRDLVSRASTLTDETVRGQLVGAHTFLYTLSGNWQSPPGQHSDIADTRRLGLRRLIAPVLRESGRQQLGVPMMSATAGDTPLAHGAADGPHSRSGM
jgi:hypothetical protein